MMEFIPTQNYFPFNGKFYQQIHGTSIGSNFAPNYANIFMTKIENEILRHAPGNRKPLIWKRYIDDIFIIWTYTKEELIQFIEYVNTIHNTIKFEALYSKEEINFLDTTIHFGNDCNFTTSLYQKPTDTCNLLHAKSFHPKSCKNSVIYSQALRYRRNITYNAELISELEKLKYNLIGRGYDPKAIDTQFDMVKSPSQADLLKVNIVVKKKSYTRNLPFVIPFDNRTIQIQKILRNNWHLFENENS